MHVTGDIFLFINTFVQNVFIAFITCFYFVYSHFLSSFWDHSDFIHLGCYYYIVSDSCNVCFGDQKFDFLSDYFFEIVSSVVNCNGNSEFNSSWFDVSAEVDCVDFCYVADKWCWACSVDCPFYNTLSNVMSDSVNNFLDFVELQVAMTLSQNYSSVESPYSQYKDNFLKCVMNLNTFNFLLCGIVEDRSLKKNVLFSREVFI